MYNNKLGRGLEKERGEGGNNKSGAGGIGWICQVTEGGREGKRRRGKWGRRGGEKLGNGMGWTTMSWGKWGAGSRKGDCGKSEGMERTGKGTKGLGCTMSSHLKADVLAQSLALDPYCRVDQHSQQGSSITLDTIDQQEFHSQSINHSIIRTGSDIASNQSINQLSRCVLYESGDV